MANTIFNDGNDWNASASKIRKITPRSFPTVKSVSPFRVNDNPYFPNAATVSGAKGQNGLSVLKASKDGYAFQAVPDLGKNPSAEKLFSSVNGFAADLQTVGPVSTPGFPYFDNIGKIQTDTGSTYASAVDYMGLVSAFSGTFAPNTPGDLGNGAIFYPNATGGGQLYLPPAITPNYNGTAATAYSQFGAFPQNIDYPTTTAAISAFPQLQSGYPDSYYANPGLRAKYFGLNSIVPQQVFTPVVQYVMPLQGLNNMGFAI